MISFVPRRPWMVLDPRSRQPTPLSSQQCVGDGSSERLRFRAIVMATAALAAAHQKEFHLQESIFMQWKLEINTFKQWYFCTLTWLTPFSHWQTTNPRGSWLKKRILYYVSIYKYITTSCQSGLEGQRKAKNLMPDELYWFYSNFHQPVHLARADSTSFIKQYNKQQQAKVHQCQCLVPTTKRRCEIWLYTLRTTSL